MNKYFKFGLLIFCLGAISWMVFIHNGNERIGLFIMLLGVLSNLLAVAFNKLRMPIYTNYKNVYTDKHHIISVKKKIKLFYLCDIIPVFNTNYVMSTGDLILIIGFLFYTIVKWL